MNSVSWLRINKIHALITSITFSLAFLSFPKIQTSDLSGIVYPPVSSNNKSLTLSENIHFLFLSPFDTFEVLNMHFSILASNR